MDFNKVRVFLVVAETGSFSKAAEVLGYTQAGVSYVVKSLEEELQLQLVERNYNGVKLSSHGEVLYPEFLRIYDSYRSFDASIDARKKQVQGTLRVGSINTIASRWFADAINMARELYPDIRYEVIIGDPFELNKWIDAGKIDVAFSEKAWASRDHLWKDITPDPYYAVLPNGTECDVPCKHSIFDGKPFFVADFGEDRNSVVNLRTYGVSPEVYPDRLSNLLIMRSVSMGLGHSIISASMIIDASILGLGPTYFPEFVKMEDGVRRTLGVQLLESNNRKDIIRDFVKVVNDTVARDVNWHRFIESDRWTYDDEIESLELARKNR